VQLHCAGVGQSAGIQQRFHDRITDPRHVFQSEIAAKPDNDMVTRWSTTTHNRRRSLPTLLRAPHGGIEPNLTSG